MNVNLYIVPTIDRDHRNVMLNTRGVLANSDVTVSSLRGEIVPSFTDDFAIVVTPEARGKMPTYATFTYAGIEFGCFVLSVEPNTPNAIRLWLHADWWYIFMDEDPTATQKRTSVQMYGTLVRSTAARFLSGSVPRYTVPADMAEPRDAVLYSRLFGSEPTYHICQTIQFYFNNNWPAADGKAQQITLVTRDAFTKKEITGDYSDPENPISPAPAAVTAMSPLYYYDGNLTYDIISIANRQFIPHQLCPDLGAMSNDGIDTTREHTLTSRVNCAAYRPHGANQPEQTPKEYAITWSNLATGTEPANDAGIRRFLGNSHVLIPLQDVRRTGDGTEGDAAVLNCTIAPLVGFVCELVTDSVHDISRMFDAPFAYNSDNELTYQQGDSRTLGLVASGLSGATQAIAGGALLATGNPMGLVSIAGAGVSVAQAVNASQYRGRVIANPGGAGALSDLDFGILCGVGIVPANAAARMMDAVMRGYTCQTPIYGNTISEIIRNAPPDTGFTLSRYEAFQFADDLIVRARALILDGVLQAPTPPMVIVDEIREAFMRGVGVWAAGDVDPFALVQARGQGA